MSTHLQRVVADLRGPDPVVLQQPMLAGDQRVHAAFVDPTTQQHDAGDDDHDADHRQQDRQDEGQLEPELSVGRQRTWRKETFYLTTRFIYGYMVLDIW